MILRFLNWQGIAGIGASLALAALLLVQRIETRHWRKQSASFEQLYRREQSAFAATVADYRSAAAKAAAADQANLRRVTALQNAITERTSHDFEARLAAARADALRLRGPSGADSGTRANSPVPGLSTAAGSFAEDPGKDRLPASDALTATEQAIQLDELIKWVRLQAKVDNNPSSVASPAGD